MSSSNSRTLGVNDTDVKWNREYKWLRFEAGRQGYKARDVTVDSDDVLTGKLCRDISTSDEKCVVDKENCLRFTIHDMGQLGGHTLSPEVHVFLAIDKECKKPYRIYHDEEFDSKAVFPLWKLLKATSFKEASSYAWFDKKKPVQCFRAFYVAFLQEELLECQPTDAKRAQKIQETLAPLVRSIKESKREFYASRDSGKPKQSTTSQAHAGPKPKQGGPKPHAGPKPKQPPAKTEEEPPSIDPKIARMMAKMGFKEGGGLGKDGSGITAPIAVAMRTKQAGLGF
jgi:hypothetical protein